MLLTAQQEATRHRYRRRDDLFAHVISHDQASARDVACLLEIAFGVKAAGSCNGLSLGHAFSNTNLIHISKSAIDALMLPLAPSAI